MDIEEHGATEGCPGCRALMNPHSRFRAKHTVECRQRLEEALKGTEKVHKESNELKKE